MYCACPVPCIILSVLQILLFNPCDSPRFRSCFLLQMRNLRQDSTSQVKLGFEPVSIRAGAL